MSESIDPIDLNDVDAVVFDMGGVFMVPHHDAIGSIVAEVDGSHPWNATYDSSHKAHYVGVRAITDLLETTEVDEADSSVWDTYDRASFEVMGVSPHVLGPVCELRASMRGKNPVSPVWTLLLEDNIAALGEISARFPVAIVSNNNGTAQDQCHRMGICQVGDGPLTRVETIVDSGAIGIAKPDPRIFTPALEALGTKPDRTLYIGDTVHADVLGATAAGMPVIQLDPYGLHADHDHARLGNLVRLDTVLS